MKKQNLKPKVSIIIPVYNGSNYLRQAIDSALAQTYDNFEVIVINDGSTDGGATEQIALSYKDKIRYFIKENGGVATALNIGIEMMEGEYFSWLSHDDMYHKDRLKLMMAVVLEQGGKVAAYSDVLIIDGAGKEKKISCPNNDMIIKSIRCFLAFDVDSGLNGCSLIIPYDFFNRYGLFNPELRYTQDYDMWFRMGAEHFFHVPGLLTISRQHEEQDSQVLTKPCTLAADALHAHMVHELTMAEVTPVIKYNPDYFQKSLITYINAGYERTAMSMNVLFFRIATYSNNIESWKIVASELFGVSYTDIKNICKINKLSIDKKERPRLLFYSNVWCRGGIERILSILLPKLSNKYDIILVYGGKDDSEGFTLPSSITTIYLQDILRPYRKTDLIERLTQLSVALGIDIFCGNPNIVESFVPIYKMMNENGIRTIAWNHGNYFLPYMYTCLHPILELRKNEITKADVAIWLCEDSLLLYSQYAYNGVYIPNCICNDIKKYRDSYPNKKNIICVARFNDYIKRADRMVMILDNVFAKDTEAKVYMVGPIPEENNINGEHLRRVAVSINSFKNKYPDRVILTGEVENVSKYYEDSDILLLTSESEGFPLVLTEAGTHRIPAVVFDYFGVDTIIKDGENGFVIDQNDIDMAAEKILLLLNNPILTEEMGNNAYKLIQRFSIESIVKKWESLIDKLLSDCSRNCFQSFLFEEFNTVKYVTKEQISRIYKIYEAEIVRSDKLVKNHNISKTICFTSRNNNEYDDIKSDIINILGSDKQDQLQKIISSSKKIRNKKLVMFHLYGWLCGGMERVLSSIVSNIVNDFDVMLVAFDPVKPSLFFLDERVKFIHICGHCDNINRLVDLINIVEPDVFVGNNNSILEFYPIYEILKKLNVSSIAYNHECFFFMHEDRNLFPFIKEKRLALGQADVSVFLTNFGAAVYSLLNDNGIVIPNPSPFPCRYPEFTKRNGKTILAVGRYNDPIKGLERLLETFSILLEKLPDVVLKIAGSYNLGMLPRSGNKECISEQIRRLGLTSRNVEFLGADQQVEHLYESSDILVVTSYNEGFSMVVCEAISYGVPVVLNEIAGLEDLVVDGVNGFIVPQGDSQAMADKIQVLLQDDKLRQQFSINAYEHASNFEIGQVIIKWKKLLKLMSNNEIPRKDFASHFRFEFPVKHIDTDRLLSTVVLEFENTSGYLLDKQTPQEVEPVKVFVDMIKRLETVPEESNSVVAVCENSQQITPIYIDNSLIKTFFHKCYLFALKTPGIKKCGKILLNSPIARKTIKYIIELYVVRKMVRFLLKISGFDYSNRRR